MQHCALRFFQTKASQFEVTVMRHGESTWNAGRRRVQGASTDPGIVLSPQGIQSIQSMLKQIQKPDKLFCSPLARCKQTAEVWLGCDFETIPVPKILVPDLREINAGIFQGRYLDELGNNELWKSWLKNPLTFSGFPNGETAFEFQERTLNAFSKICIDFSNTPQNICIITHGIVMRVLHCFLNGKDLSHLWDYQVANLERVTLTNEQIGALQKLSLTNKATRTNSSA